MKKLLLIFLILIPNLIFGVTFYNNDLTFGSQDIDDNLAINFSGLGFSGVIRGDSAFGKFRIQEGGSWHDLLLETTQGRVPYAHSDGYLVATDGLFFDAGNVRLGINNNVPSETLDILGNAKISNSIQKKTSIFEHTTKPAAPSAGHTKNYYKSDGKYYQLTAADVETEIAGGGGGGAAGDFNYIDPNGDAELMTTYGWACTGNLSIAVATSTPIYGSGYFTVTAAANSDDDYCAYDFDLEGGDNAEMLSGLIERVRAGTGYDTGDASLRLYDLDDSKYINNDSEIWASTIGMRHDAGFQTHATNSNYELRIVSNVDTTFTLDFDNVKLQRGGSNKGVPATSWETFTPVLSGNGTLVLTANYARWKQSGDTMLVSCRFDYSSGTGDTNYLQMDIPNGLSFDTSGVVSGSNQLTGSGYLFNTGKQEPISPIINSNKIRFAQTDSATNEYLISSDIGGSAVFWFEIAIPISGWQAEAAMSSTRLNRNIHSEYHNNSGETLATTDKIPFLTATKELTGAWDGDDFTVQEDGRFCYVGTAVFAANAARYITAYRGAVAIGIVSDYITSNDWVRFEGCNWLSKGNVLSFRESATAGLLSNSTNHRITIWKSGTGTEKLFKDAKVLVYAHTSTQLITTSMITPFVPTVESEDSHNAFASGIFTAPYGASYTICHYNQYTASTGWDATEGAQSFIVAPSGHSILTYNRRLCSSDANASNLILNSHGCRTVRLETGETASIALWHSRGGNNTLQNGEAYNWITITSE